MNSKKRILLVEDFRPCLAKKKTEPALIQAIWQTAQTMRNDDTLALSNEQISLDTFRSFLKGSSAKATAEILIHKRS